MRTPLFRRIELLQIRLLTPVFLRLKERLRLLGADPGQTPEQQAAFRLAHRAMDDGNLTFARSRMEELYRLPGVQHIQEELVRLDLLLRRHEHRKAEALEREGTS